MADQSINQLLGGSNLLGLLDPSGAMQAEAERRAQAAGLLNFAFGALQASRGVPGQGKPGLAQIVGQAGPAGISGYQQSFGQTLGDIVKGLQIRSSMAEMNAPKYMTLKTPAGGEALIQIPRGGGAPSPVQIPGFDMGAAPINFDAETQAFVRNMYNKPFDQLNADQQRTVIAFSQAPNERQATELRARIAESTKDLPQNITIPMPKTRTQILQETLGSMTAPTVAPRVGPAAPQLGPVTPQVTPVTPPAQPQVGPVSATPGAVRMAEVTPEGMPTTQPVSRTVSAQIPVSLANKPLGANEAPLINSREITPKQKSELELNRPQTFTSTETALNITRQIRNSIKQVLEDSNFNLAFGFGGETVSQYYTPAANVRAKLDQIKNQLFVEGLTTLRSMSQTGAGVGNVTQQEGTRFENLRGALVQFQSADQAKRELNRIDKELEDTERRLTNAFGRVYGTTQFDITPLYVPQKQGSLRDILFPQKK